MLDARELHRKLEFAVAREEEQQPQQQDAEEVQQPSHRPALTRKLGAAGREGRAGSQTTAPTAALGRILEVDDGGTTQMASAAVSPSLPSSPTSHLSGSAQLREALGVDMWGGEDSSSSRVLAEVLEEGRKCVDSLSTSLAQELSSALLRGKSELAIGLRQVCLPALVTSPCCTYAHSMTLPPSHTSLHLPSLRIPRWRLVKGRHQRHPPTT